MPRGGAGSRHARSRALRPGRSLGRYRLCYELASGGMGAVYLARAEGPAGFDKLVALKCIHEHLAEDPQFVEMFLDEARIAARITHPNVCSVFDFGVEDGTYYIAMEYVLGETAARISRAVKKAKEPTPPEILAGYYCHIAAQAAEGLHGAHQLPGDTGKLLGVIHRDVSPSNLFVSYDGNVQVMDFGIARAAGRIHVTQTGALKGKLAYTAPEQLSRQDPDRRIDIWALGVVLWELLTGKRLFRRESEMATLNAVANEPVEPPSQVVPGIPPRVDEIVMRALSRDRDERYSTAREMARDLARCVASMPEPIGVSEVAEWMEALFHDERARRLELVDQARKMGGEGVPGVSSALRDEDSSSSVRVHASDDLPTQVTERAPEREPDTVRTAALPEENAPTSIERSPLFDPVPWWKRPRAAAKGAAISAIVFLAVVLGIRLGAPPADRADVREEEETAVPPTPATEDPPPVSVGEEPRSVRVPAPLPEPPPPEPAPVAEPAPAFEPAPRVTRVSSPPITRERTSPRPERVADQPLPPPPVQEPAEPGVAIVIATGGWADVYRGGQRIGPTPARVTLRPGTHTLELRPFGDGSPIRRSVVVPAGGEVRVVVPIRAE